MSKRLMATMLTITCSALVLPMVLSAADAPTPQELQKARSDHYHQLGDAVKVIRDQTKAATPDFAAIQKAAQVVSEASIDQGRWFPKGTGVEAGKTRALAIIWDKPADFLAAQKQLTDAAPAVLAAAKASDIEALRSAFSSLGGACKNCHDTFRAPKDE
jgi:cytochrome c556